MKELPTKCPICKKQLSPLGGAHETDYLISYCANCTLPVKDDTTRVNTAFEVRVGRHTERYLTRLLLCYNGWNLIYYPYSDEQSPPEIHCNKSGQLMFYEEIGQGITTLEDWEDWSDVEVLINKVKMRVAFQ